MILSHIPIKTQCKRHYLQHQQTKQAQHQIRKHSTNQRTDAQKRQYNTCNNINNKRRKHGACLINYPQNTPPLILRKVHQ